MGRTICIWFPDWPLRRPDAPPDSPIQVVGDDNRVTACSQHALEAGVVVGMRRREAEAVCPTIVTIHADPGAEAMAFEPIVLALEEIIPKIEVTRPGLAFAQIGGAVRYFGGEKAVVAAVVDRLELTASDGFRIGLGAGPFASRRAAHLTTSHQPVFVVDDDAAFLATLDVGALGHEDLVSTFRWLGITTLGELARLPRDAVASRFGRAGLVAHRIAVGEQRPTHAREIPVDPAVEERFDPPLENLDQAAFVARSMAVRVMEWARTVGAAPHLIEVSAESGDGTVRTRIWRNNDPFDEVTLAERVRWQLRAWLEGVSGGIRGGLVRLQIVPAELSDEGRQLGLQEDAVTAGEAYRALAQTQALLGPDSVLQARPQGGRSPGDRIAWHRWGEDPPALVRDATAPWPGAIPSPAPALVPPQGRRIEVDWDDGLPHRLRLGSRWVPVLSWAGPWRTLGKWWEGEPSSDRYQLVTSAGAFLCEVKGEGSFLIGIYD